MHRIDAAGFAAGNLFTDGNPSTGTPATVVDAAWLNDLQENVAQLVEAAGIVLSKGDYTQLLKAIVTKGLQGCYFNIGTAAGTADAITSSYTPAITALANGMTLYVRAASVNATTTPTFTPNSGVIAAKTIIKGNGLALAIGDIAGGGHWIELQYDATLDKWVLLNPATGVSVAAATTVQASFKNLQLSAAGTNNAITATIDEIVLENASSQYMTIRGISGVSVAVGSGSGVWNGTTMLLDTGSWASSTWYSVWVISTPVGVASWLYSLSATAPTMPSGYTYKARVGWIRTDGTANKYPLSFIQTGRRVQYKVVSGSNVANFPLMASGITGSATTPTYTAVAWANFAPSTAGALNLMANSGNSGATTRSIVSANNATGIVGANANPPPINLTTLAPSGLSQSAWIIPESSNVYCAADDASFRLLMLGWEDNI